MSDALQIVPAEAAPFLANLKQEAEQLSGNDDLFSEKVVKALTEMTYTFLDGVSMISVIQGMMDYINENQDQEDHDDSDDEYYEGRIKTIFEELIQLLLQSIDDNIEVMFFFRTCFFNFTLHMKDMKSTIGALGHVFSQVMGTEAEEDE